MIPQKTISNKQAEKVKEEINSDVKQVRNNKQELKTSAENNVSTYKQNSEKVDTKKMKLKSGIIYCKCWENFRR